MKKVENDGEVVIPSGCNPWPHELKVAKILADSGRQVKFLPARSVKMADILLDGVEFEIKSPFTNKPDKLERNIKRALKQSKNVVYDASRIKGMSEESLQRFLSNKARQQSQIKRLILITKKGKIIDIK